MTSSPFIRPAEHRPPHRLRPWQFGLAVTVLVLAVGLLAALVTWVFYAGPRPQCIPPNCPPPMLKARAAVPLEEEQSFRSSRLGFALGYPGDWEAAEGLPGGGVHIDTDDGGFFEVIGVVNGNPAQLIVDRIGRLNQQVFPDVKALGTIRGARIGGVNGTGTLYGATFVPTGGGSSRRVRFALIAAQRGPLTLLAMAADWYDQSITNHSPFGMRNASAFDYALTAFRWPGE
jgi:hypothetical protein